MNRVQTAPVRMVRPARLRVLAALLLLGGVALAPATRAAAPTGGVLVNINTATSEELQALPGVGESRAAAIVALRKERGAFREVDELLEVRGIGPSMLERMRPQVSLSGKTRLGPASGPSRGSASSGESTSKSGR